NRDRDRDTPAPESGPPVPGPPVPGPPNREGSPTPEGAAPAVHNPPDPGPLPPGALEPLPIPFYLRPVLEVTRDLLGRLLVHQAPEGPSAVRLVETEAYDGAGLDPASHAHRGPTQRNAVMFGPPGHLYLYFTYGMHWCANVVCAPEGTAQAVLLRAGEPVCGTGRMQARRPASRPRDLARGPARLCAALGLAGWANGLPLDRPPVLLTAGWPVPDDQVAWTGRVGVTAAADRPWRALVAGHPAVSPGRPGPAHRPARRGP
ncbi:MAG TPA: DNA-3-methyladenine glycosylase, partial [Actinomycetota bacterium]